MIMKMIVIEAISAVKALESIIVPASDMWKSFSLVGSVQLGFIIDIDFDHDSRVAEHMTRRTATTN